MQPSVYLLCHVSSIKIKLTHNLELDKYLDIWPLNTPKPIPKKLQYSKTMAINIDLISLCCYNKPYFSGKASF